MSVFRRGRGVWTEVATLAASDATDFAGFGGSVYLYDMAADDCGTLATRPDEGGCTPLPDLVSFSGFE